ncbi:NAD(P)-binding domain-containing protein [Paenibacillus sp. FSL H8-0457]|nr:MULTISPECIES: NAD(P)-binding domain-containing protein [Paenibacillus]
MGKAMVSVLLDQDYNMTVWNRTSSKADDSITSLIEMFKKPL